MGWIEGRRRWVWFAGLTVVALLLTPVGVSEAVPVASGEDIMIIAAHPDDDVITAAGITQDAIDAGSAAKIAFVTNGDRCETPSECTVHDPDIGTVRQAEAVAGQAILGNAESNVIFLGYPNGFLSEMRYGGSSPDFPPDMAHPETYATRGLGDVDWHTYRNGSPAPYIQDNLHDDLIDLIDYFKPDHIFTHSRWDRHQDHEKTYFAVIEAVKVVQTLNPGYTPYIHTTIVHIEDSDDCYPNPSNPECEWGEWPDTGNPTAPVNEYFDLGADSNGELVWDQRESFEVPASMQNTNLGQNPKSQAIEAHETQADAEGGFIRRFIHKDEIFWVEKYGDPEGIADAYSVVEGDEISVTGSAVLMNDVRGFGTLAGGGDPTPLGRMTAVKLTDPDHGSVSFNPNGSFTYTHDGSESASDSFTYRPVQGSTPGSTTTVTITINPINDAPTANPDGPYVVANGGTRNLDVVANDTDPENGTLTPVEYSDPQHGTLKLNADGSLAYTHDGSTTSSDSFTYRARDAGGLTSNSVTVSLQIDPVELPVMKDIDGNVFADDIMWLVQEGITKGCNPPANDLFCPNSLVTRGQMAAFMVRFLGLTASDASIVFVDTVGSVFDEDIRKLATAGITRGCNPPTNTQFCPHATVTRGQMAAFLARALGLSDNGGGDLFTDDDGSIFEADIDRLATAGVTRGCNADGTHFCPNASVTRGQMAAFLRRAGGLLP